MNKILLLSIFLAFSIFSYSQEYLEDYCYITLYLKANNESIEDAKFYKLSRQNIKVEFTKILFKNGASDFGKQYFAKYNQEKDAWTIRVPKGIYRFRTQHPGFKSHRETIDCDKPMLNIDRKLKVDKLPYTYDMGRKYNYIRGGIEFSETIIVHFKSGSLEENMAFLESFPHEKVQKIKYVNAFLLTLNLNSQESLPEILLRETLGDEPLGEGFYFGDAISEIIEKIIENPNVSHADPTFIFPKHGIEKLSANDFSTLDGLVNNMKDRTPDSPKMLNPDDFEQSDALIQKLIKEMEEN